MASARAIFETVGTVLSVLGIAAVEEGGQVNLPSRTACQAPTTPILCLIWSALIHNFDRAVEKGTVWELTVQYENLGTNNRWFCGTISGAFLIMWDAVTARLIRNTETKFQTTALHLWIVLASWRFSLL